MSKLIKYMFRWQLSTPILAIIPFILTRYNINNFWVTALIANLIGSLIFFKIDEVIFDKLKDRADEISDVYRELKKDVEMSEKRLLIEIKSLKNDIGARVGVLEKYRWIIIGGAIVIGWILSKNFMPIMHMMASN